MGSHQKKINPKAQAKFRQALAQHEKGQLEQAHSLYQGALQIDSQHAEAIHHLGIIALQSNDCGLAAHLIQQSLALEPRNPAAFNNLGMALEDCREPLGALQAYDQAITLDPNHFDARINRGNVLQTLERWDEALNCYEELIMRLPQHPDPYNNRGNVLRSLKRYQESIESFDRAIALNPKFAQAWNNRGIALKDLKKLEAALQSYDRALALAPNYAEAYSNRGIVLKELKQYDLALQNFDLAIQYKSNYAQAFGNRGGLYQELKKYAQAYQDYDRAIFLNSNIPALLGKRLHMQMHLCDWHDFDNRRKEISKELDGGHDAADPFTVLGITDSLLMQKQAAQVAVAQDYPPNPCLGDTFLKRKKQKIRIGYFSADFRNHPVSYLMVEVFEKHDKSKFELFAFNVGKQTSDPMQQRVAEAFDHFIETGNQTDLQIASLARSHEIDIAVDLGGFTIDNRPGVFALRAAPVQIGYIGYLGTMGAPYYDYIVADPVLIPEKDRQAYTEKIIYLKSYQANDSKRKIANYTFTRQELGLPEQGFVFCCFNNNFKFTPNTFDAWMRILKAVPDSVLFLFADQPTAQQNLKKQASARGIQPERIIFGASLERGLYLARYKAVDLFLDTLPYNAGTTASDALWSGLPVLTCTGQALASRMAASLLTAIECNELITESYTEYEAQAIKLATDTAYYLSIREKLRQNISTTALFDSDRFCKDLELAYLQVHTASLQS